MLRKTIILAVYFMLSLNVYAKENSVKEGASSFDDVMKQDVFQVPNTDASQEKNA